MKPIILFFLFCSFLFGCTGDCLTCHPKLVPTIHEDQRHKPMLGCIECHSADPNSMAECGSDCFGCHSMQKINAADVRAHDVIQGCRDCHVGAKEELFDISLPQDQSREENTLKEFLSN